MTVAELVRDHYLPSYAHAARNMWQGRELVSVVLAGHLGVRLENCTKPIPWTASAVPDLGEAVESVARPTPVSVAICDTPSLISAACKTPSPVLHAAAALLPLLTATVLAVYKPRGMTRYGWCKQQKVRRAVPVP